jgi:hypothetical protein
LRTKGDFKAYFTYKQYEKSKVLDADHHPDDVQRMGADSVQQ